MTLPPELAVGPALAGFAVSETARMFIVANWFTELCERTGDC
jgi:hypothetical protein